MVLYAIRNKEKIWETRWLHEGVQTQLGSSEHGNKTSAFVEGV